MESVKSTNKYLITVEAVSQVNWMNILGYAENKNEIFALIYNFYKYFAHMRTSNRDGILEDSANEEIIIYQISDKDWKMFHSILDKYEDQIDKLIYSYKEKWGCENELYNNYLYLELEEDDKYNTNILTIEEIKIIQKIIENSEVLLD